MMLLKHIEILNLLENTVLTQREISYKIGCHQSTVSRVSTAYLSGAKRIERSLLGDAISKPRKDGIDNGYMMVSIPPWYTGRAYGVRVREHVLVACKSAGISEIPDGYVVHHIDENRLNNELSNLVIVSRSAHAKIHAQMKVRRVSTKKFKVVVREGPPLGPPFQSP